MTLSGAAIFLSGTILIHASATATNIGDVQRTWLRHIGGWFIVLGGILLWVGNVSSY